MTRVLSGLDSPSPTLPEPTPDDDSVYFNSEFILFIGLFVIFCFLICLILLNACACWLRPRSTSSNPSSTEEDHFSLPLPLPLPLPAAKLLRTIPKLTYSGADNFTDCAICLTEFVPGDEIRVLPRCGHCFHVVCVDRWIIGSHFTCPSCRQMLLKTTEI